MFGCAGGSSEAGFTGRQTREARPAGARAGGPHRDQRSWSTDAVGEAAQLPFSPFHPSRPASRATFVLCITVNIVQDTDYEMPKRELDDLLKGIQNQQE